MRVGFRRRLGGVLVAALVALTLVVARPTPTTAAPIEDGSQWTSAMLPLVNGAIAGDPSRGTVLVGVADTVAVLGNHLVELDATDASISRSVFVGSKPDEIAVSDDATRAYVSLGGASAVAEVDLATFTVVRTFPLVTGPLGPPAVFDLAVQPGHPEVVAVAATSPVTAGAERVTVYDAGTPRTTSDEAAVGPRSLAWDAPTGTLYAHHLGTVASALTVDAAGVTLDHTITIPTDNSGELVVAHGLLHLGNGSVIDPATGAVVGSYGRAGQLAYDDAQDALFIGSTSTLSRHDASTYAQTWSTGGQSLNDLVDAGPTLVASSASGTALRFWGPGPSIAGYVAPTSPRPHAQTADSVTLALRTQSLAGTPTGELLVGTTASDPTDPTSLVVVDPASGVVIDRLALGAVANGLTVSGDGTRVLVRSGYPARLTAVDLTTLTVDGAVPLTDGSTTWTPGDVVAVPGTADRFVVELLSGSTHQGVGLVAGTTLLPDRLPASPARSALAFGDDPAVLYGLDDTGATRTFSTAAVTATGLTATDTTLGLTSSSSRTLQAGGGRLWSTAADVLDPTGPVRVGTLARAGQVVPVPAQGRTVVVSSSTIYEYDASELWQVGTRSAGFTPTSTVLAGSTLALGTGSTLLLVPYQPPTAPGPPREVTVVEEDGALTATWSPPSKSGGVTISGYTATVDPGGSTCTAAASSPTCTIGGLTNGQTYTVTVTATNAVGTGAPSDPSAPATPYGVPDAPTSVVVDPGYREAAVSWTPPTFDGGSPLLDATVTAQPGGAACTTTATSCIVSGLETGATYEFSVTVRNARGPSAPATSAPTVVDSAGVGLVVDTATDSVDLDPGDGSCADADGHCSLRAAVMEADAHPDIDFVTLPPGDYQLTRPGRSEDAAATGDLDVTDDLIIDGRSATIDATGLDRVLHVLGAAELTLDGVTVTGGDADYGGALRAEAATAVHLLGATVTANHAFIGGGLLTFGALTVDGGSIDHNTGGAAGGAATGGAVTLTATEVHANTATGLAGGWAAVGTGPLTVTDSALTANHATAAGGLYTAVATTLDRTIVEANTASRAAGVATETTAAVSVHKSTFAANEASAGIGGALFTQGPTEIADSRITANTAQAGAGLLAVSGVLGLSGSTLDANTATDGGGGLAVGPTAEVTVANSTFSANTGPIGAAVLNAHQLSLDSTTITDSTGTGLHTLAADELGLGLPAAATSLANTIVGPATASACAGGGALTSLGHNLASDTTCALSGGGDLQATDPLLSPLADNGGPTPTHLPDTGSPTRDVGATTLTTDQRHAPRPTTAPPDIGAVEVARGPLRVGGAHNFLGTGSDPADALPASLHENLWLSVSGPCASAENGDAVQTISDGTYEWTGGGPADTNPGAVGGSISWGGCQTAHTDDRTDGVGADLYDPDGYLYGVDVATARAGQPLTIDVYDAPQCNDGSGPYPTNPAGDGQNSNLGTGGSAAHVTRYRVLGPDDTPGDPTDNPVVAGPFDMLHNDDAWCGTATTDWQNRWKALYTTTSAEAGTYVVQVQTDSDTDPTNPPTATDADDYHQTNQFALRAHQDTTWDPATSPCSRVVSDGAWYDPTCPVLSSIGWAGIYANLSGVYPTFRLGQVEAAGGARLVIDVWDPGEGTIGLEVLDPLGRSVDFDWEVIDRGGDVAPTGGWAGTVTQPGGVPCNDPAACAFLDTLGNPNTDYLPTQAGYYRGWNPQPAGYRGSRSSLSDRLVRLSLTLPPDPATEYGADDRWSIRYRLSPVSGNTTDRTTWRAFVLESDAEPPPPFG